MKCMKQIKNKNLAYFSVVIVAVLALCCFIFFSGFSKDTKYDYIPYLIGTFSVFTIYIIKNSGKKPDEITLNNTNNTDIDKE